MHYVVTGGAGFIGSHLCDALLAKGHRVTVLDDLSSGKREQVNGAAQFIHADAARPDILMPLIETVDGIFHLAAIASVDKSRTHWRDTTHANLMATVNMLDHISKRSVPVPFIYASSAAIYGNHADCPISEATAAAPETAYGVDKYASEMHARVATHIHHIPTTGLRFFNVFGERQDPRSPYSGVISIFARAMMDGRPVSIHGDGTQTRDFIYVGDVVTSLVQAMDYHQKHNTPAAIVSNVCCGEETSILELFNRLAHICNYRLTPDYAPSRSGDIKRSCGDPQQHNTYFGAISRTTLDQGLMRTITWMEQTTDMAC